MEPYTVSNVRHFGGAAQRIFWKLSLFRKDRLSEAPLKGLCSTSLACSCTFVKAFFQGKGVESPDGWSVGTLRRCSVLVFVSFVSSRQETRAP